MDEPIGDNDEVIGGPEDKLLYDWYTIPAAVVNEHAVSKRVVPDDERKKRVEGWWIEEDEC